MRRAFAPISVLLAALLCLLAIASTTPAAATTVTPTGTITGRVEQTWLAAGGSEILGDPIGVETKIVAYSRNTYHQHTTYGATVYWDGAQSGRTWLASKVPSLSGVASERDALGRYGFTPGLLSHSHSTNATRVYKSSTGTADESIANGSGFTLSFDWDVSTASEGSSGTNKNLPPFGVFPMIIRAF